MAIINERNVNLGSYGVSTRGVTIAGLTKVYKTLAERDADQKHGTFAFVRDASADPTVKTGFAIYYRKADKWKKVFEEEAMDQDISELVTIQWENVIGKPNSSSNDIDDAVAKAHEHANKETLDKISVAESFLKYDDEIVTANPAKYTKWLQLVRPTISEKNLHCTVRFYTTPNLQNVLSGTGVIDTTTNPERFMYFDGAGFKTVEASIPNISAGRFVIVDVQDIIGKQSLYIEWTWTEADPDTEADTGNVVSSGLCVYPSITPTNTESVGLVWVNQ